MAVGLRWNDGSQAGDLAFMNTNVTPPVIKLQELTSGWTAGTSPTSSALTLTAGNTYTLVITDNGTTAVASLFDDVGPQSCSITPTLSTSNQEVMFGWVGTTASFTFASAITGLATTVVATATFSPTAGTYTTPQTVTISSSTSGASIYYTTDGSTPTTASNLYTGPITVSSPQTINAVGALPGWANSAVGSALYAYGSWTIEYGTIDGSSSGAIGLTGSDTGTTSASVVYASTWCAATAYQNIGTSNNIVSVTFIYQGPEGGGGVAAGVRWSDSSQEGDLAFLNTNSTPPVLVLYEMSAGWGTGTTTTSLPIALTSGNSYTLTIADDGTTVSASIVGDLGPQSCSITATLSTSNQEVMIGWVGVTASHPFSADITDVAYSVTPTVTAPTFWPAAGAYTFTQSVTILPATPGSATYYTTDGSTPTNSSTLYTGPITVSASQTVKAIGVLAGWTTSSVASAAYTITSAPGTPLGTASTNGTPTTSLTGGTITVPAGGGLMVLAVMYDNYATGLSTPTFSGGGAFASTTGKILGGSSSWGIQTFCQHVSAGAGAVTVNSASGLVSQNMMFSVWLFPGLANNVWDSATSSGANGVSGVPYTLTTAALASTSTQTVDAALNASAGGWAAQAPAFN